MKKKTSKNAHAVSYVRFFSPLLIRSSSAYQLGSKGNLRKNKEQKKKVCFSLGGESFFLLNRNESEALSAKRGRVFFLSFFFYAAYFLFLFVSIFFVWLVSSSGCCWSFFERLDVGSAKSGVFLLCCCRVSWKKKVNM